MRLKKYISMFILLLAGKNLFAQKTPAKDTALKGATIEIIQSYKPEVKQVPKPALQIDLPPADEKRPAFDYNVPQQNLNYTYNSPPLRPLALNKINAGQPFENYLKAGAGNLSTVYIDGAIGSLHGENYATSLHLHHISQSGDIKYQNTSLSRLEAEGSLNAGNHTWHVTFDGKREGYNYYGFNHNLYTFNADSLKQAFTGLRLNVDMKNRDDNELQKISYHPGISLSSFTDKFSASEQTFAFSLPCSYSVDTSLQLRFGIDGTITQYKLNTVTVDNNIYRFTPAVKLSLPYINLFAGLYPTIGRDGTAYLLPDINASYVSEEDDLHLSIGWQGNLRQNSYEQMSARNPFMYNAYLLKQTHTNEIFGTASKGFGDHLTLSGRISWWQFQNLPLFINDTNTAEQKQFVVVYDDKVNAFSIQLNARYQLSNTFSLGAEARWINYSNSLYRHVWHEPATRLKADFMARPMKNLSVTGYLSVISEIYALDKNNRTIKLDGIFDLGGSAEYSFIPRLSAFLTVNNLLNNKYQRWYGYSSYGLNIYGGIRIKF